MGEEAIAVFENAIRTRLECEGRHVGPVPVREVFRGETLFEGVVHVFDLVGHATAPRAYVWDTGRGMIAVVLHEHPVDSPLAAVRAAIASGQLG